MTDVSYGRADQGQLTRNITIMRSCKTLTHPQRPLCTLHDNDLLSTTRHFIDATFDEILDRLTACLRF